MADGFDYSANNVEPLKGTPAPDGGAATAEFDYDASNVEPLRPKAKVIQAPAAEEEPGEFGKGIRQSLPITNPGMLGNFVEAVGDLTDHPGISEYGRAMLGEGEAKMQPYAPRVPGMENIRQPADWSSPSMDEIGAFASDVWDFANWGMGVGIGSTALPLAGGLVGSLAGPGGTFAGQAFPSFALNANDVLGGLKSTLKDDLSSGRVTSRDVAEAGMMAGSAMAALDVFSLRSMTAPFTAGARETLKRRLIVNLASAMSRNGGTEGLTEALQETISQWTQAAMSGQDFATRENAMEIANNAAVGALTGAAFGIPGGAKTHLDQRRPAPRESAPAPGAAPVPPPTPAPEGIDPATGLPIVPTAVPGDEEEPGPPGAGGGEAVSPAPVAPVQPPGEGAQPTVPPAAPISPDTGLPEPQAPNLPQDEQVAPPATIVAPEGEDATPGSTAPIPGGPEAVPTPEVVPATPTATPEATPAPSPVAPDSHVSDQPVDTRPTDGQKEAGNYQKGHVKWEGLDVTIETPKGAERSGVGKDGKPWSTKMWADYGYIRKTESGDGEQVDVYLGPTAMRANGKVWVIDQKDPDTGKFDEHKVVIGAKSQAHAQSIYDVHFSDDSGPRRRKAITEMTVPEFKAWLKDGDTTKEAAGYRPAAPDVPRETSAPTVAPPAVPKATPIKPTAKFTQRMYRGEGREDKGSVYGEMSAGVPILGAGRYYATNEADARHYGPTVTAEDVSLENPLVIDSDAQWRALTKSANWQYPNPVGLESDVIKRDIARLHALIRGRGHDGVVVRLNDADDSTKTLRNVFGHDQAVVFDKPGGKPVAAPSPPEKKAPEPEPDDEVTEFAPYKAGLQYMGPTQRQGVEEAVASVLTDGRRDMKEHIIGVRPNGKALGNRRGGAASVTVPADVVAVLGIRGNNTVVVHNHPGGTSLSGADIALLHLPGHSQILAVAHGGKDPEGTIYAAALTEPWRKRDPSRLTLKRAWSRAMQAAKAEVRAVMKPGEIWGGHVSHATNLVMARAGIIDYHVSAPLELPAWFDHVIDKAAQKFIRNLRRTPLRRETDGERVSDRPAGRRRPEGRVEEVPGRASGPAGQERSRPRRDPGGPRPSEGDEQLESAAFHGGPHDFDQFTTEKIGTGEGAQVYGWGLYFAGNRQVAEYYKEALSRGKSRKFSALSEIENANLPDWVGARINAAQGQVDAASQIKIIIRDFMQRAREERALLKGSIQPWLNEVRLKNAILVAATLRKLLKSGDFSSTSIGKLYEVELAPQEDEYLHWDAAANEQPEGVKAALDKAGIEIPTEAEVEAAQETYAKDYAAHIKEPLDTPARKRTADEVEASYKAWTTLRDAYHETGGSIYQSLVNEFHVGKGQDWADAQKSASLKLRAAGIPGIKYFDQQSRGGRGGSYNYVIFDEAHVKITKKYQPAARPNANSNGQVIAHTRPVREAFWKWFGDSKIVDAEGKPLVVYHGTDQDITEFKPGASRWNNRGLYFTKKPIYAEVYAWARSNGPENPSPGGLGALYPVYLSVKNPKVIKDAGFWQKMHAKITGQDIKKDASSAYVTVEQIAEYERQGYDGIVNDALNEIVVFHPTQIKSINNQGSYNPNDPSILARAGGEPEVTPAQRERLIADISKLVKRFAPNTRVEFVKELFSPEGRALRGSFDPVENLISISLAFRDPNATVRHEVVHALREFGLIDEKEWAVLAERARASWIERFNVREVWADMALTQEQIEEEAVAEAFAAYRKGDIFPPGIRGIFKRLADFLTRVGNLLVGRGFNSVESVMAVIERGEVGRREFVREPSRSDPGDATIKAAPAPPAVALTPAQQRAEEFWGGRIGDKTPSTWERLIDPTRSPRQKIGDFFGDRIWERLQEGLANDIEGLHALEKAANSGKLYTDVRSAAKLAAVSRAVSDTFFEVLHFGAPVWKEGAVGVDTTVKPFMKIVDEVEALGKGALKHLEIYMVARRAQELLDNPLPGQAAGRRVFTDMTDAELRARIREGLALDQAYNGALATAAQDFYAINKRVLDFVEQGGLLNSERDAAGNLTGGTRKVFEDLHANYVPLFRIMEGGGVKGPHSRIGFQGQHPNFYMLRGGEANIEHPIANIEQNMYRLIEAAVKNMVMLRADEQNTQTGGVFMAPVAKGVKQVLVSNQQMVADLRKQGIDVDPNGPPVPDVLRLLWSLGNKPKGDSIVSFVRNGKIVYRDVTDPMLYRAFTRISATEDPLYKTLIQPFRAAKRLLTSAVTMTPAMQVRNLSRDTLHVAGITDIGFVPIVDSLRGMKSYITKDPFMHEYFAAGGGLGTLLEGDRRQIQTSILSRIESKGGLGDKFANFHEIIQAVERVESSMEYATRIGVFRKLRERGVNLLEATWQAKESSTDFSRRGAWPWVRVFTDVVPFLNAGIQGLMRTQRGAMEGDVKWGPFTKNFLIKAGIMSAISVAFWMFNKDRDGWDDMNEFERDLSIHIPHTGLKWPIPFEYGLLFKVVPERIAEAMHTGDVGRLMDRMWWSFNQMFRIDIVPQLARPIIRVATNRNEFRDRPVVPRYLEDVAAEFQYDDTTPEMAKRLGEALGYSPLKIQALVEGYLAEIGTFVMWATDVAMRTYAPEKYAPKAAQDWQNTYILRSFVEQPVPFNTRHQNEFYEGRKEVRETWAAYEKLKNDGDIERAQKLIGQKSKQIAIRKSMEILSDNLNRVNRQLRAIDISREMTPEEKREARRELLRTRNRISATYAKLKPFVDD